MTATLFDQVLPPDRIAKRFEEFHEEHPEVYKIFKQLAFQIREAGHKHYSSRSIVHQIRWHFDVNPNYDHAYKVNDHYARCMGDKLTQECEEFKGFFKTKPLSRLMHRRRGHAR